MLDRRYGYCRCGSVANLTPPGSSGGKQKQSFAGRAMPPQSRRNSAASCPAEPFPPDCWLPAIPGADMRRLAALALTLFLAPSALAQTPAETTTVSHALAMHGDVKYGPEFKHFDYVDPNVVKGGEVKLEAPGQTFDTLNPFTLRGVQAAGSVAIYDSLMASSADEPFTEYCLLCETIEMPEN